MFTSKVAETEFELIRLSHEFAFCLDYHRYDELVQLFTPDGVWGRIRELHRGHQEITEGLKGRSSSVVTRHVSTNFHFSHVDENTVKGVVYNLSHFGPLGPDGTLPATPGAAHGYLLDFHDVYRRTADGWRFAERIAWGTILEADSIMMPAAERWRTRDYV